MDSFLEKRVAEGVARRYGPKRDAGLLERAKNQVAHELKLIAKLGFAGYFLIVWDIVEFCKKNSILIQGRGSAANSAVCYALEITAIDPVGMELLFERFLSESRGEWPDIDLGPSFRGEAGASNPVRVSAVWRTGRGHDGERDHVPRQVGSTRGG